MLLSCLAKGTMQREAILAFQSAWLPAAGMEMFAAVNFAVLMFNFPLSPRRFPPL